MSPVEHLYCTTRICFDETKEEGREGGKGRKKERVGVNEVGRGSSC